MSHNATHKTKSNHASTKIITNRIGIKFFNLSQFATDRAIRIIHENLENFLHKNQI